MYHRCVVCRRHGAAIPFDLLAEAFKFDPDEPRNFHGQWMGSTGGPKSLLKDLPGIPEDKLASSVAPGKWDATAKRATTDMLRGRVEDTEHAHRRILPDGSLGEYSPARQALHQEILNRLFQGKQQHPQDARAIFMAGGGGSGKSSMIRKGHVDVPADVVHSNPDIVREMLPEYKLLKAAGRQDASSLTHEEASHLSKLAMQIAMEKKYHVLIDSVGGGAPGKFADKVERARDLGHKTSVHYATVPVSEAIKRADARGKKTGRYVPESVLRQAHKQVSERYLDGVRHVKGVHVQVFDTSAEPKLIAEKTPGSDNVSIKDRAAYKAFAEKAKA
jgi:predicted ABC-type ATPase